MKEFTTSDVRRCRAREILVRVVENNARADGIARLREGAQAQNARPFVIEMLNQMELIYRSDASVQFGQAVALLEHAEKEDAAP